MNRTSAFAITIALLFCLPTLAQDSFDEPLVIGAKSFAYPEDPMDIFGDDQPYDTIRKQAELKVAKYQYPGKGRILLARKDVQEAQQAIDASMRGWGEVPERKYFDLRSAKSRLTHHLNDFERWKRAQIESIVAKEVKRLEEQPKHVAQKQTIAKKASRKPGPPAAHENSPLRMMSKIRSELETREVAVVRAEKKVYDGFDTILAFDPSDYASNMETLREKTNKLLPVARELSSQFQRFVDETDQLVTTHKSATPALLDAANEIRRWSEGKPKLFKTRYIKYAEMLEHQATVSKNKATVVYPSNQAKYSEMRAFIDESEHYLRTTLYFIDAMPKGTDPEAIVSDLQNYVNSVEAHLGMVDQLHESMVGSGDSAKEKSLVDSI